MNALHDPYSAFCRCPQGALPAGSGVCLRLTCSEGVKYASVRLWKNDAEEFLPMRHLGGGVYEANVKAGSQTGLIWYYFVLETETGRRYYVGKPIGGVCGVFEKEPTSFQITVYDPKLETPKWMRNSVMLQIMVDRFAVGGKINPPHAPGAYLHKKWGEAPDLCEKEALDFFGGNLEGIRQKLPYIKELGIGALYLNPIFRARSNHKYDTSDYMQIDPSFGTQRDFELLCRDAADMGMHIVLDGVFSHTGADSRYFNLFGNYDSKGAYSSYGDSPYSSWYRFKKGKDDYDCWWGFETLPNVNETDPSYMNYIVTGDDSVIAHWLKAGASGWRLDVADELPMEFIRALRKKAKHVNPDACVIGEVWEDITNKVAYGERRNYAVGDSLDSAMNYPLRSHVIDYILGRIDADKMAEFLNYQQSSLPRPVHYSMMNLLDSHDKPRIISVLAEDGELEPARELRCARPLSKAKYELGKERFIRAFELICALPGMPCLYYGDEAGLYGMGDPFCRGTYPWGGEDRELQSAIRDIIRKRNASDNLRNGDMWVKAKDAHTLEITRCSGGREERLTVKQ